MTEAIVSLMIGIRDALDGFILPIVGVSYWKFCLCLMVVGAVITVLVNGVRSTGSNGVNNFSSSLNTRKGKK